MEIIIVAIVIVLISKGITKLGNIQLTETVSFMSKVIVFGGCCTVAFQMLSNVVGLFEIFSIIRFSLLIIFLINEVFVRIFSTNAS